MGLVRDRDPVMRLVRVVGAVRRDDDVGVVVGDDDLVPVLEARLHERGAQVGIREVVAELLGDDGAVGAPGVVHDLPRAPVVRLGHALEDLGREIHPDREPVDGLPAKLALHVVGLRVVEGDPVQLREELGRALRDPGAASLRRSGVLEDAVDVVEHLLEEGVRLGVVVEPGVVGTEGKLGRHLEEAVEHPADRRGADGLREEIQLLRDLDRGPHGGLGLTRTLGVRRPHAVGLGRGLRQLDRLAARRRPPEVAHLADLQLVGVDERPALRGLAEVPAKEVAVPDHEHQAAVGGEDGRAPAAGILDPVEQLDRQPFLDRLRRVVGLPERRVDQELLEHLRVEARCVVELGDQPGVEERLPLPGVGLALTVGRRLRGPNLSRRGGEDPRPGAGASGEGLRDRHQRPIRRA